MTETPKAREGTWTLTAPDGRKWEGDSPLRVVGMESRERVPAHIALARILKATDEVVDPDGDHIRELESLLRASEARERELQGKLDDAKAEIERLKA